MNPDLDIVYINLDSSTGRRQAMEHKLAKALGPGSWRRFPAVSPASAQTNLSQAELGCYLSHQQALASGRNGAHVLVLEDDAVLARGFLRRLQDMLGDILSRGIIWDVIFLSQLTDISNLRSAYTLLNSQLELCGREGQVQRLSLRDCKGHYASGAAAYLVHPASRDKVRHGLQHFADQGFPLPVDLVFKRLIDSGGLNCKFVFPYLVGLENRGDSTIQTADKVARSRLMEDLANLFFIDCDTEELLARCAATPDEIARNPQRYAVSQIIFRRLTL